MAPSARRRSRQPGRSSQQGRPSSSRSGSRASRHKTRSTNTNHRKAQRAVHGFGRLPGLTLPETWGEVASHAGSLILGSSPPRLPPRTPAAGDGNVNVGSPVMTLLCLLLVCFACGAGVWGWCVWLENQPRYEKVRGFMLSGLGTLTVFELALHVHFTWWMPWLVLFVNLWGYLDALLRYPVVHECESLFALKHLLLVLLKVAGLVFGCKSMSNLKVWLFLLLLVNIAVLPICYCFALPLDESEAHQRLAAHDVVDDDIAVRVLKLVVSTEERALCAGSCQRRWNRLLLGTARRWPLAAQVLGWGVPSAARSNLSREAKTRRGV